MQILETTPATVLKEPVVGKEFVLTEETLNKELEKYHNLLKSGILEVVDSKHNRPKIKVINKK